MIVRSLRALETTLKICRRTHVKWYVLGAGTNVLCSDKGYSGIVLKLGGYFTHVINDNGMFRCNAGLKIDHLIAHACTQGYGGAEFLAGIPGTLGGAIYCNAGAFGRAIGEIVEQIRILTSDGKVIDIPGEKIDFQYRSSGLPKRVTILSALLRFQKKKVKTIRGQLHEKYLYRENHQPKGFSAGSFFKNPRPFSAGKLIDECGLKGRSVGGALVSAKHANWIINNGSATASDVSRLAMIIKRAVKDKKGITLTEEVRKLK